jgi:hypothetical protein
MRNAGGNLTFSKKYRTYYSLSVRRLPAAVLSCAAKKVPKEGGWGGFEWLAPASQATSPRPLQATSVVFAVLPCCAEINW